MLLQSVLWVAVTIIISLFLLLITFFFFRHRYRKMIGYRKTKRAGYSYVYFYRGKYEISNLPFVKIGRTRNMKQRMRSAKTSNPFGIWLLGVVRVKNDVYAERFIHQKFAWARFRTDKKNEWFWYLPVAFFMWCVMDYKLTKQYKDMI